jgi:hypothetical protein
MRKILALLLSFFIAIPAAISADDPPTEFSKQVTAALGDWEAENWRNGMIRLHPAKYNAQSDIRVSLMAEEPIAGRTPLQTLISHFEGDDLGDDSLDPTVLDMKLAKEIAPGILAIRYGWSYGFDENDGFWGVITTKHGTYIPFTSICEEDDSDGSFDPEYEYRYKTCIEKSIKAIYMLREGTLRVPAPATPMSIAGYENQYNADGTSIGTTGSQNGLRLVQLYVSPPRNLSNDQLAATIKNYSEGIIHRHDQADDNRGSMAWVGNTSDPWLRREFPEAFDGPSIHMIGTAKTPDGRSSIIGVRCPNKNWLKTCAYGVEQAKFQVQSGVLESRRQVLVAATQGPPPTNGIKDAQLLGVYAEGRNTAGPGGFMTGYVVDGYLYFKDGRVCDCFYKPPAYIDPVAESAKNPGDWGRWTKTGNKINVRWNDGNTTDASADPANLMVGGTKGLRLDGYYRNVSGGGDTAFGGGNSWLAQSSYTFYPDGTFENDSSSSFMVGPGIGADGANAMGGSEGAGARGRYEVDGYTVKLTYPDGRVSRIGFAVYAKEMNNQKRGSIMVNGTVYFRND